MEKLPIKQIPLPEQQPFIEKANTILTLNKNLHTLTTSFLDILSDNLSNMKLTKKLEDFYDLSFADFLAELKKQKIVIPLVEQEEWRTLFIAKKEEILKLKGEIERVDGEIDEMVFELYGLSKEEVKRVLR